MTAAQNLLDDQEQMRAYFLARSRDILRRKDDPARQIKSIIYLSLANNHWSLEGSYVMPGFSLATTEGGIHASNERQLYDGLSEWGPPPLDGTGRIFLGCYEMFRRATDASLVPAYYAVPMGRKIVEEHIDSFRAIHDGANILELCVGDGTNAAVRNKTIVDSGASPKKIILSDLVRDVVEENAITALIDAGVILKVEDDIETEIEEKSPLLELKRGNLNNDDFDEASLGQISEDITSRHMLTTDDVSIISGDIHTDEFWAQKIFADLRKDDAPTVLIIDSQTWNDFSADKRKRLLRRFREELKPGSDVLIFIDSTRLLERVEAAYNHVFSQQWLVRGFVSCLATVGIMVDPKLIRCRIDVEGEDFGVTVKPYIVNLEAQHIKVKVPGASEMTYVLPEGDIPCDTVYKLKEYILKPEFVAAGMESVTAMTTTDPARLGVRTSWWHMKTPEAV